MFSCFSEKIGLPNYGTDFFLMFKRFTFVSDWMQNIPIRNQLTIVINITDATQHYIRRQNLIQIFVS